MANLWNVVNLNQDDQSGILQIVNGHPLLMYLNLLVTPPPPGGGPHTIEVHGGISRIPRITQMQT